MLVSTFLSKIKKITPESLNSIQGLGPILIGNLIEFQNSKRYDLLYQSFKKLEEQNIFIDIGTETKNTVLSGSLTGEVVCITGVFEISRSKITENLTQKGAKVVDSVNKNITILLAGDKAGSKLAKATKLGIKIIYELSEILN
jgi:DNA ligase (NAD+)